MWKQWRPNYKSGFSAGQFINLIPVIVEQVVGFRDLLRERTRKNEIFRLGKPALNLSIDIIGKVMDRQFNSQRAEDSMVSALLCQVQCAP